MSEEQHNEKLRRFFRELRSNDARSAPSFDATWRIAEGRAAAAGRNPFILMVGAAAAVVALVIAGAIWFHNQGTEPTPVEIASISLSDWQSPTTFLLETPGADLWTSVPSLDRTWMQSVSEVTKAIE